MIHKAEGEQVAQVFREEDGTFTASVDANLDPEEVAKAMVVMFAVVAARPDLDLMRLNMDMMRAMRDMADEPRAEGTPG